VVGDVLHRKLLRDARGAWLQFAAAAAVVFCATSIYVSFQMTYAGLIASRDAYYQQCNFADFFVHLEKAPRSALRDVESVPGVWQAQGRIVKEVPLQVEGNEGAVVGRLVSMPRRREGVINDIHILSGAYFPGASGTEVIVNERFCQANGLQVGDSFQATINERKKMLRIVGTAYSPEYVYPIRTVEQMTPDDKGFAVIFAREDFVEDAFNMTNAFNDLVGILRPGANVDGVLDAVKARLDRHGVYLKYGRADQISNRFLSEEIKGIRNSARVVPAVFLLVAAVVIHIIVHRITEHQRTQIGLMCALGYSKARVVGHYVSFALIIGLAGAAAGLVGGHALAGALIKMYVAFFRFPSLEPVFQPSAATSALLLSCGMCVVGAARSAWNVLKIDPAVAMRPTAPGQGRPFHGGRGTWLWRRLPLTWRIALRNALRAKSRSLFGILGVATSTLMLVLGAMGRDYFAWMMDYQFGKVDRADARVTFLSEMPETAVHEIASVEGVRHAEGVFQFGAELSNGWRKKVVGIMGLPPGSRLYHVYDTEGRRIRLPEDGLIIPERLARELQLTRGARVTVDPYLKDKDECRATVRAVIDQYIGLNVYADRRYLARLIGEGPLVNGAMLTVKQDVLEPVMDRLDDIPGVTAVTSTRSLLESFAESVAGMMMTMSLVQTLAAAIIAFAVIYNAASVSIAEQERDLACMCSLGYDREDVARAATNDIMPVGLIGILVGLPLAYLAGIGLARAYETDLYKLPVLVYPETYARAVVLILVFLLVSRWMSRRRVYKINIVRRLKTRE